MELLFLVLGHLFAVAVYFYKDGNTKSALLFQLSFFIIFLIVVRLSGFDTDMIIYADTIPDVTSSFYFLREPAFWFPLKFIYNIVGSIHVAILVFDALFACVFAYTCFQMNVGRCFLLFALSFPFFLGYENIYRQYCGMVMLILSLVFLVKERYIIAMIIILFAALFHNVYVLFLGLPIFMFVIRSFESAFFVGITFVLLFMLYNFLITVGLDISLDNIMNKSIISSSGNDLTVLYFIYLVAVSCYFYFFEGISKFKVVTTQLYIALVMGMSVLLLTGPLVERVALICIVLSIFSYCYSSVKNGISVRLRRGLFLWVMLDIPIYLTSSTMSFV